MMPWTTLTKMNQRIEFVLKAQTTTNFRALCQEYGIVLVQRQLEKTG
jgi:hypothetical protein